jgi:hypothetical protein
VSGCWLLAVGVDYRFKNLQYTPAGIVYNEGNSPGHHAARENYRMQEDY